MNTSGFLFVADNIRSIENVGSLFRTADGLGGAGVVCVGISSYPDQGESDARRPYLRQKNHQLLKKTALSGIDLPFWYFATAEEAVAWLKNNGYAIICIEQHTSALNLLTDTFTIPTPYCLVLGNEIEGVGQYFLQSADLIIEFPMFGKGKSLNVSVSAGIAAFELLRRKQISSRTV